MKYSSVLPLLVIALCTSWSNGKKHRNDPAEDAPNRKLFLGAFDTGDYTNGSTQSLSDGGTKNSLLHLQMLVDQQKSLHNYKIVGHWLTDLDNKLDDVRDSVSRRLADMSTSLQRRNSMGGHYAMMGGMMGMGGGMSPVMRF